MIIKGKIQKINYLYKIDSFFGEKYYKLGNILQNC